jgi:hypothetical protein
MAQYTFATKTRDKLKHAEATCTSTVVFRAITPRCSLAAGGSTSVRNHATSATLCRNSEHRKTRTFSAVKMPYLMS